MTEDRPRDLDIVLYTELLDTVPQAQRVTWERLADLLSEHAERDDKDGPGWSATVYRPSTTRGKAGVTSVTALVFDIDHDEPQWSLLDGLEYVAHTTWKHHASSEHVDCLGRDDCPHWRVVLPLAQAVDADAWDTFRTSARFWLCPNADESAKDAPRFFWMPTRQIGKQGDTRRGEGRWLDPRELRAVPADEPVYRKTTTPPSEMVDGERPGDRFEREADWCRDLLPDWKPVGVHGDNLMMRRPGSTHPYGATISRRGQGVLYVFTDGAPPLAPNTCYSKFWAYVTLEHAGNTKIAVRTLAERYGMGHRQNGASIGRIGVNGSAAIGCVTSALPEIYADEQDLRVITGQAWDAIVARNDHDPSLFLFGGEMTRVEMQGKERPIARPLGLDHVRYELARLADWWAMRGPKDDKKRVSQMPPLAVCRDILATPQQPLPILERIVGCPVYSQDGRLQIENGYCAEGRTFVAIPSSLRIPAVSSAPSMDEQARARSLIVDDLLADFLFVDESDRTHAIALGLEPFVRSMITGPLPLHDIEAPTAGTGKGLLAHALLIPSAGLSLSFMDAPDDEDEMRKRLLSVLRNSPTAIVMDNLGTHLSSSSLASVLTVPDYWEERVLGSSTIFRVPVRCSWVVTANNPSFSEEMTRRVVRTRIDARMGDPSEREGFRHDPLSGWVHEHRGELIWAYCTLIQAWIVDGQRPFTGRFGSYEGWSRVVGGILMHAGIGGFLQNQREFRDAASGDRTALHEFVQAWWDEYQSQDVGAKQLFAIAQNIAGLSLGQGGDHAQQTAFGIFLRGNRDRVVGEYVVRQRGKVQRAQQWCLIPEAFSL